MTGEAARPAGPRILVVDDDPAIRRTLAAELKAEGYAVSEAADGREALASFAREEPDLVLTDLRMPDGSGLDVLRKTRETNPETPVVMITAYTSTRTAIEALKAGAYDYVSKPFDVEELKHVVGKALERKRLADENVELRTRIDERPGLGPLIGVSRRMRSVFDMVERIGRTTSTVLITGESGTGKGLIARAIHRSSSRAARPFVSINCGALPENLLESELFGHEKGAFTGAVRDKKGLFKEAEGGTLFLDEIGETSLAMQVKLLQVLQERVVRRVGGNVEEPVDVRILCATNKDLARKVAEKEFREDFYYRIAVIPMQIPPLRERREDIPALVRHFLRKVTREQGIEEKKISAEAMRLLEGYPWPGNVRELENLIERTVALEPGTIITTASLPETFLRPAGVPAEALQSPFDLPLESFRLEAYLEWIGKRLMQQALERANGVRKDAARLVGMSERSFRYYAKKYGLGHDGEEEPYDEPGPPVDEA